jgi:hypothetical protein
MSFADLGILLKRSPAAVKMQLYRTLDRLADRMQAYGQDRQEI